MCVCLLLNLIETNVTQEPGMRNKMYVFTFIIALRVSRALFLILLCLYEKDLVLYSQNLPN